MVHMHPLCARIPSIHSQFSTRHVTTCFRREKGNSTHKVFWLTHLTLWDQGSPLRLEVWVLIKDLLSPKEVGENVS